VDLEPTNQDWIEWAGPAGVDAVTVDFIRNHPEHLRVDPSSVDPGTICPTPASWHRLDDSLQHMNMAPTELAGSGAEGLYALCSGFVGTEAAIAFHEFIKRYESVISADDVLGGKIDNIKAKSLQASESLGVIDKIIESAKTVKWTKKQALNIANFVKARGGEQLVYFWNALSKSQNLPNIQALHKHLGTQVVEIVRAARGLDK
jgi:hypothetical protein